MSVKASVKLADPCPCGGGEFATCCGPFLAASALPTTAEQLMRSRYTAFVLGDADHLWRTWHPRTRPAEVSLDADVEWLNLTILDAESGGPSDTTGVVEFAARHRGGVLHERSRFERRAGRWFYLDGVVND